MGAIGKIDVSYELKHYSISLVKWGFFRKILAKLFRASPFQFIPSYEIAIYDNRQGKVDLINPLFVFHFAKKETFKQRTEWAKEKISSGGIKSLIEDSRHFNPKEEGIYYDLVDRYQREGFS